MNPRSVFVVTVRMPERVEWHYLRQYDHRGGAIEMVPEGCAFGGVGTVRFHHGGQVVVGPHDCIASGTSDRVPDEEARHWLLRHGYSVVGKDGAGLVDPSLLTLDDFARMLANQSRAFCVMQAPVEKSVRSNTENFRILFGGDKMLLFGLLSIGSRRLVGVLDSMSTQSVDMIGPNDKDDPPQGEHK